MSKVAVKLAHPDGRFKDASGLQLEPHKIYMLDEDERVKKAIEIGLLRKEVLSKNDARVEKLTLDEDTPRESKKKS